MDLFTHGADMGTEAHSPAPEDFTETWGCLGLCFLGRISVAQVLESHGMCHLGDRQPGGGCPWK